MHRNAMQRLQILEILYRAFERKPGAPWVNEREIKKLGDMAFALAALLELGHARADGPNYKITGSGILAFESADGEE